MRKTNNKIYPSPKVLQPQAPTSVISHSHIPPLPLQHQLSYEPKHDNLPSKDTRKQVSLGQTILYHIFGRRSSVAHLDHLFDSQSAKAPLHPIQVPIKDAKLSDV